MEPSMSTANDLIVQDQRFALTDWERKSVKQLKAECDKQKVEYKSLFELAKYILVVKSSVKGSTTQDDEKRLLLAFNRIKGRREWEKRFGIDKIDAKKALLEYDVVAPGFLLPDYDKDEEGHVVLAFSKLRGNLKVVTGEWKSQALAALLLWFDLAAADMSEARRGIAVASMVPEEDKNDSTLKMNTLTYLRGLVSLKDVFKPVHNHRVRCIYSVSPLAIRILIEIIKRMLPHKLQGRMKMFGEQKDVEKLLRCTEKKRSFSEWVAERSAIYDETTNKLQAIYTANEGRVDPLEN